MTASDLTEDMAKKILDFLCKRHGNGRILLKYRSRPDPIVEWINEINGCPSYLTSNVYFIDHCSTMKLFIFHEDHSSKRLLEMMLEQSSLGNDVFIGVPSYFTFPRFRREVLIPAHSTIESLMIGFDLYA